MCTPYRSLRVAVDAARVSTNAATAAPIAAATVSPGLLDDFHSVDMLPFIDNPIRSGVGAVSTRVAYGVPEGVEVASRSAFPAKVRTGRGLGHGTSGFRAGGRRRVAASGTGADDFTTANACEFDILR